MKKKALLSSILTIALCLSLIAGSTFALFTSESKVNVAVTAGKVDVVATIEDLELYSPKAIGETGTITDATNAANETFVNGGTATLDGNKLTLTNITPGDKVTFNVKITNNSNVTIKYRSIVEKIADKGLWTGLKVTIGGTEYKGETKKSDWTVLNVGSDVITVPVVIELPTTAGSTYQEKSCELAYTVEAVQGNAEVTSEWNGETTTPITESEDGKYHITTAAELVWLMDNTQGANSAYLNETIVLENNIDLGGATVKGIGSEQCSFAGNFDGQNHTIKNFVIERSDKDTYAGLFNYVTYGTISNLTVENATINGGTSQVGALAGSLNDNAKVTDCTVKNCTVIANRKVGGAVGYVCGATVENVSVKDTTIYVESTDAEQYGKVVGFENTGAVVNNVSDENVNFIFMARVNTLDALTAAVNNTQITKIVLTDDITNEEVPHTGGTNAYDPYGVADTYTLANGRDLIVDFNGHVLTTAVRLFNIEPGATLTLKNSDISGKQSGIYFNKTDADSNAYGINVQHAGGKDGAYGILNIEENVTLAIGLLNASAQPQYGGMIRNCGIINMNGGELIAYGTSAVYIFSSTKGDFIVNNGKITLGDANATGITSFINSNAQVKLINGSIEGKGTSYVISSLSSTYKFDISDDFVINTEKGPQN